MCPYTFCCRLHRCVLVRVGCEFCRVLPDSADAITLLSLFSMGDNKLWISISGFESLGGSQIFSITYLIKSFGGVP